MRNLFKKIYQRTPFKKQLFIIIRSIVIPKPSIKKYLRFKGYFNIKVDQALSFYMFQNFYQKESELFWNGIDGYESFSLKLWIELSKISNIIFDVGANSGIYSLLSKCVNSNADVYAFEPVPKMFANLEQNVKINNYNLNLYNVAVSDSNGQGTIYDLSDIKDSLTASLNKNFSPRNQIPIATKLITLDFFVREKKINKVDLIKIDVETHEPEVLRGFLDHLTKFKPTILIEILNQTIANDVESIISNQNYLIYRIDEAKGAIKQERITSVASRNYLLIQKEILEANLQINKIINNY